MNAIILAAGKGTRLQPLTYDTPKPLIILNGKPLIERQIEFLQNKGIVNIIIVTGYLCEKFEYLKEKYNVKLIHNDKFDVYNNFYTMYLVRNYLTNSFVIEGDIYLHNNIIDIDVIDSTYFSPIKDNFTEEWILNIDENFYVRNIEVGSDSGRYIMSGVSYWNSNDGIFIKNELERYYMHSNFKELFWDNIIRDNLNNLKVRLQPLKTSDLYEIDSLEDLKNLSLLLESNEI